MKITNLSLVQPTPEHAARTCGPYWYLISHNGTSFTAFCRKESFLSWLRERGLSLEHDLAEEGVHDYQKIIGEYESNMLMSYDEFFALEGERTRKLSNARYTMAIITDNNGIKVENYPNVNCKDRPEYDYQESRAMYG